MLEWKTVMCASRLSSARYAAKVGIWTTPLYVYSAMVHVPPALMTAHVSHVLAASYYYRMRRCVHKPVRLAFLLLMGYAPALVS